MEDETNMDGGTGGTAQASPSPPPAPKKKSFGTQDKYLNKDKKPEKGKPDIIIMNPMRSDLIDRIIKARKRAI